ncbi:MAG: transposase [Candidatus Thiodiazotropha sp.]
MKASIVSDTIVKTDGPASYFGAPGVNYERHVIGTKAAHIVMPAVGRVFSNLKTWGVRVYQGLRRKYLQVYLDEFAFRFNWRKARHAAFTSTPLLAIAVGNDPIIDNILKVMGSTG